MNSMVISSTIDKTFQILETELSSLTPADQISWLQQVGETSLQWDKIGNFSVMAQARILYTVWKKWNSENEISFSAKAFWNHEFMNWAKTYTQSRGAEPAEITITNKVSIYRDWIAQPIIKYPEVVIINNESVPFDPQECDYSKLLQARAAAKQGILTDKAWAIIANPKATVTQLQNEIKGTPQPEPDEYSIIEESGIFYAIRKGKKVALMATVFDDIEDELFQKAMNHIFKRLGLVVPVEYV